MIFVFFLFVFNHIFCNTPVQIEGIYQDPFAKKIYLIERFLTFDPSIIALDCSLDDERKCMQHWPNGVFSRVDPLEYSSLDCDLLWVDSEGSELHFLEHASSLLKQAKVVYTSTHFFHKGAYYKKLERLLSLFDFKLLIHWFQPEIKGHAIFVKKELLDTSLKTLNYWGGISNNIMPSPLNLEPFLKPVLHKSSYHKIDGIDFIYMINLDERPEKFALTSKSLEPFGIIPYRFSAVNGWKLATHVFDQLGVKFAPGSLCEKFLGTTYKEVGNRVFMSNELLQENGTTYFTLGLSPGAIGIILSHLSILKDAYESNYKTIWVMEDDVEPIEDPRQLSALIQKLDEQAPDWDILFTDTDTKDGNGNHVPCRAIAARPNTKIEPIASFFHRFYAISNEFSRIGMRYGAYSMIIRRSGMKKILDYFKMNRLYLPYDMDFWLVPGINLYSINKDIVSHRPGSPSDNSAPFYLNK